MELVSRLELRLHKYETPVKPHHILYRLEILLFYIFYYGQVTIFRTLCITGQFVKLSFDTEGITPVVGISINLQFTTSRQVLLLIGLVKYYQFRYFMVKLRSFVPRVSWVNC